MKLSADDCAKRAARAAAEGEAAHGRGDREYAAKRWEAARAWQRAADEAALRALSTAPRAVAQ